MNVSREEAECKAREFIEAVIRTFSGKVDVVDYDRMTDDFDRVVCDLYDTRMEA